MGALVFIKGTNKQLSRIWTFFCLAAAIWGFGGIMISTTTSQETAFIWWQISDLGIFFSPVFYFHFVSVFCESHNNSFLRVIYSMTLISLTYGFLSKAFPGDIHFVFNQFYWPYWPASKNLLFLFLYIFLYWFLLLYTFGLLSIRFRKSKGIKRNQYAYFILASIIGWIGGAANFLPTFGIRIYPYCNFLVAFYTLIFTYAILRHHLMDINIVIKRTAVYSMLVTLITVSYFILIYIVESSFRGFVGYKSISLTIGFLVVFTLLFQPLKNFIQSFIDKYFFKGSQAALADELQKAQEELKRTERLKAVGTLAAGMAHEIKNPLTGIKTFTEYLPAKQDEPGFIDKFHKIVSTEVDKINSIVQQLLDFSKPKPLQLREVNIHQIIDQTLALLSNSLIKHKITLIRNYDNSLPLLHMDPNQMQQVFCNIFLNAIESMKEGGQLTITTANKILQPSGLQDEQSLLQENYPTAQITISDTGKGIPKKDLEHIFDPFYTTKESGTGLGMSIIYGIIKEHKGTIEVESKENKGTSFIIKLPLNV